jgi:cytochrome c peroxidase
MMKQIQRVAKGKRYLISRLRRGVVSTELIKCSQQNTCLLAATIIALATHSPLCAQNDSTVLGRLQEQHGVHLGSSEKTESIQVGMAIFLDTNLSNPKGQACISCHIPQHAFADPQPQSTGAMNNRVGTRNAPSLMYAALIPSFAYDDFFTPEGDEIYAYEGGLFWDGSARDLFEQVQKPFFHANEMNLDDEEQLANRLRQSTYSDDLKKLIGEALWQDDSAVTYHAYLALVTFLRSPIFRPFDSKLDQFLAGDRDSLDEKERRGMKVYINGGKCNDCHPLNAKHWDQPLLSDFGYDNLGVPSIGKPDGGLGAHTGNTDELGQFRSPSLRNVAITAPYMHNGSLKTLREVVEFYNNRDTPKSRWKQTDFPETVNRDDMGNLKLNDQEVDDLIAFLHCFTDRCIENMSDEEQFPIPPKDTPSVQTKSLYFPGWTQRLHRSFKQSTKQD